MFDEYLDNSNMVCITNLFFHAFDDGKLSKSAHFSVFYFTLWQNFINKEMFLPTIMYLLHRYAGALFFGKISLIEKRFCQ
jgi:hypothetical protein